VVGRDTVLLSPSSDVITIAREKVTQPDLYRRVQDPMPRFNEMVFRHEAVADDAGYVTVALVNKGLEPFGCYVRYRKRELPHLFQWKMLASGAYVVGLEPSSCWIEPRSRAREGKRLNFLELGQAVHQHVEIGVCTSSAEIQKLEEAIRSVGPKG